VKPPGALQASSSIKALTTVAAVAAVTALVLRATNSGWGLLIFGLGYLLLCIVHVVVHRRAARSSPLSWGFIAAVAASNLALICAFLLQWDAGDSSPELTLATVFRPANSPGAPLWMDERSNLALLVPIATWPLLFAAARSGAVVAAAGIVSSLLALSLLAVVALVMVSIASESARYPANLVDAAGGPPPANCGSTEASLLRPGSPAPLAGSGARPVWVWRGEKMELRADDLLIGNLGSAIRYDHGRVYVNWLVEPTFAAPVMVRIVEASTKIAVMSSWKGRARVTTQTLSGEAPKFQAFDVSRTTATWMSYYIAYYFERAGCYELEAESSAGMWRIPLAAGQVGARR
jgi:hypothetical protein